MSSEPAAEPKTRFVWFPAWVAWTAVAVAVLALAWATLQRMTLRTELVTVGTELRLAQLSLTDAQQRREADHILWQHGLAAAPKGEPMPERSDPAALKIVLLASPQDGSPPAFAAVVWHPTTPEGVWVAQSLPAPPPGQVYRLWAVDPQYPQPVAVGAIGVDPSTGEPRGPFKAGQPLPAAVRFFVSLETRDSGSTPKGPVVLASP
jgi:hypothetical protein